MLFGTKGRNVFGRNSNPYQLAVQTPLARALDHGWYPVTSGVLPPAGITKWVVWSGGYVGTIGTLYQLGMKNGTPVTITKIVQGGPTGILVRITNAAASTLTGNPSTLVAKGPVSEDAGGDCYFESPSSYCCEIECVDMEGGFVGCSVLCITFPPNTGTALSPGPPMITQRTIPKSVIERMPKLSKADSAYIRALAGIGPSNQGSSTIGEIPRQRMPYAPRKPAPKRRRRSI